MHIEDYQRELREKCFEYFYWFARFEFALKENEFVRAGRYGEALADWRRFIDKFSDHYELTKAASALLESPPQRQICRNHTCDWEGTDLESEKTQLGKVVLVIKTIRNNLFHGGKSGQEDWDDPKRNLFLLTNGKGVLDSLAAIGSLDADYRRLY